MHHTHIILQSEIKTTVNLTPSEHSLFLCQGPFGT